MDIAKAGLQQHTFRLHGKPLCFVQNHSQQAALVYLNETYTSEQGIGIIEGPPLIGKTTVLHKFIQRLPATTAVAVVDCRNLDNKQFLSSVLTQFGYELDELSVNEQLNLLEVFLIQQCSIDHAPIIFIDNAHELCATICQSLCRLAKTPFRGENSMRVVLVSNRPLGPVISAFDIGGIRQESFSHFHLGPMTETETINYLYTKLRSGGCKSPESIVPERLCDEIFEESDGYPGLIDRIMLLRLKEADELPLRSKNSRGSSHDEESLLPSGDSTESKTSGSTGLPELIVTSNGKTLQRLTVDRERCLIGRSGFNDISISSTLISRHHAMIIRKDGLMLLIDLNSTNGVFVNSKYAVSHVLRHNDVISLGNHFIKVSDPGSRRHPTGVDGLTLDETVTMKVLNDMRRSKAKEKTQAI